MLWWWKDHFHTACSRDQGQSWGQGCRARVQVGETGVWKGGDQNRGVLSHPTTSRPAYWGASRDQHWGDVSIQFWGAVPTAEVGLSHEHCCFRASTRCSSWLLLYSFIPVSFFQYLFLGLLLCARHWRLEPRASHRARPAEVQRQTSN